MIEEMLGINLHDMLENLDKKFLSYNEDSQKVIKLFKKIQQETNDKYDYSSVAYSLIQYQHMLEDFDFPDLCHPTNLNYICQLEKFIDLLDWDINDDGCLYFVRSETTFFPMKNKSVKLYHYFFADLHNYFLEDLDIIQRMKNTSSDPNHIEVVIQKHSIGYTEFFDVMYQIFNSDNWNDKTGFNASKAFNRFFNDVKL